MSTTVLYIAAFLVIAHFVAAFVFLAKKLGGPRKREGGEGEVG